MPWIHSDATRFTKKADTQHKRQIWAETANSELKRTGDDGAAIKAANSAVKHYDERTTGMHHVSKVAKGG
jgi:hypothetical protein